jgi:hypothetical protein
MPVGESGLPSGGPAQKGLPLDSDIPGTSTYAKPVQDIREPSKDDENIHRVDNADDLTKDRSRIDLRNDNADKHDGIGYNGQGTYDGTGKTTWPYRDDHHHPHYAALDPAFVVESYRLAQAQTLTVRPDSNIKIAVRLSEVMEGLNPKTLERSRKCAVTVRRVDVPNLRWIFSVDCGNGPKAINLKVTRAKNVTRIGKMDLEVKCSCPAWQWLGPEYHAKQDTYQDGKVRGTASTPDIRDPNRHNRVCKHVAAVMQHIDAWELPKSKK